MAGAYCSIVKYIYNYLISIYGSEYPSLFFCGFNLHRRLLVLQIKLGGEGRYDNSFEPHFL